MAIFNQNYSSFIINYSFVVSGTLTTPFTDSKIDIRYKGLKKEHDYDSVCNKTWRKRNKP